LSDFAERHFALHARDKHGVSYAETLTGLLDRARTAERREWIEAELACPPRPPALDYLWRAFLRLHHRRTCGDGPAPLAWSELSAFMAVSGVRLSPWEIEMIEDLDNLWLAEQARSAAAGSAAAGGSEP
jgi:hypothetical protein